MGSDFTIIIGPTVATGPGFKSTPCDQKSAAQSRLLIFNKQFQISITCPTLIEKQVLDSVSEV